MDGAARSHREGEATALRLAVDGDPCRTTHTGIGGGMHRAVSGQGRRQQGGIEAAKGAVEGRLVRRHPLRKAHRPLARRILLRPPLRDREGRKMVGEHRGNGEGEQGGDGEALPLSGAGIAHGGERIHERMGDDRWRDRSGCIGRQMVRRWHRALL